jgi:hypothetical protein
MTDLATPTPAQTPTGTVDLDAGQSSGSRRQPKPLFAAERHNEVVLPPQTAWHRRVWKDRRLMHYNRLVALTLLVNLAVAVYGFGPGQWFGSASGPDGLALGAIANLAVANLTAAILIRQQYVINLLFAIATAVPTSWPLPIRWTAGKVYHFGGIHVGGAIAGTAWFVALLTAITINAVRGVPGVTGPLLAVSALIVALLAAMIVSSIPRFRAADHDRFEHIHRFGGWTVLGLFWVHTVLLVSAAGGSILSSFGFWALVAISVSIALPWLRLRRVPVDIERPSNHVALARFDYGVTPFAGSSTTISRSPLTEWHSFANVPAPDRDGYRLTISRAGDWTGDFIDDRPSHVWVKGIPTAGVGNVDKLFKRVVWVATGSGIGPTLPHLLSQKVPAHLVWATRDPWATYGQDLVDEILAVQPRATIWDTNANGKPDMVKLAYQAVEAFDAEAVIVISNKKLTWQVVEGMERIGVPAYGAIWDS